MTPARWSRRVSNSAVQYSKNKIFVKGDFQTEKKKNKDAFTLNMKAPLQFQHIEKSL